MEKYILLISEKMAISLKCESLMNRNTVFCEMYFNEKKIQEILVFQMKNISGQFSPYEMLGLGKSRFDEFCSVNELMKQNCFSQLPIEQMFNENSMFLSLQNDFLIRKSAFSFVSQKMKKAFII